MAARCASCSYPLSVRDSVSCCECLSYFHIDCAQLVGFPYYELSSDPIRNTFHCQTCKILPLPRQSNGFSDSDSDSDGECTMPSRQLDYHLEGQPDIAKDMNEVKGSVEDLSELCKDMFKEINELKSINLTLRCCVENLRHDSEQRDGIISELKRRIEALEGKGIVSVFKPINTTEMCVDEIESEKEVGAERYSTPDPDYSRLKEIENLEHGSFHDEEIPQSSEAENLFLPSLVSGTLEKANVSKGALQSWESPEVAEDMPDTDDNKSTQTHFEELQNHQSKEHEVHFAEEKTANKVNNENDQVGLVKDWDWRGNEAISVKGDSISISVEDEEEENETSDIEETEEPGWEILGEGVKSDFITKHREEKSSESIDESEDETEEKRVSWADEVEKYDEEDQTEGSNEGIENSIEKTDTEYLKDSFQPKINSQQTFEAEEAEEPKEDEDDETDEEERTSLRDEEAEENPKLERDIAIVEEGVEVEGRVESAEESRLEGEVVEGAVPEGVAREGGQSPEVQGEVQPSELSEGYEPPPPPQPQHTPDDLWDYLKESVSGEHPATVEEFVQKLIGTLEHVPEEYLKPVIDYNIKRATSPSVTDGEHLDAKDGDHDIEAGDHGLDQTGSEDLYRQENSGIALEGEDHSSSLAERESPLAEEESAALHEDRTNISEDPSESTEGYSAVEGAMFGGFWVAWVLYSFWDS